MGTESRVQEQMIHKIKQFESVICDVGAGRL